MAEEDMIFGKNRHLFGGIQPSDMKVFSVFGGTNSIVITATLPNDTVINGYTLCTVAGAVIRRKKNSYPIDEFDGDLIADIKTSGTVNDSTANMSETYYYAAFPYSKQGVYNRDEANRAMYAFVPCDPCVSVTATINPSGPSMVLNIKLASDAVGAVIRRSTSAYPENETDGEQVTIITSSGNYTDVNVEKNTTYYYQVFPYNASGTYNREAVNANRASVVVPNYTYFYGYDLTNSDSNPSNRVMYPSDVDNASYTAALMGSSTFSYGSWPSTPGEKFMPKPCLLSYSGTVSYYLSPNDYTKRSDGSTSSNLTSSSVSGNFMMEWPKIYTKRWEENGIYHFRCSDGKLGDDYECWSNYDRLNNEIPHFYTAIYNGWVDSSKRLRSISGQTNLTSETADTEATYAKNNGADWYIEVVADRFLIQDLLVMVFKSTDLQTALGYGCTSTSNSSRLDTGTMNTKGLFWGSSDKTSGVKAFGMENLWGNIWRRVAGWMFVNYEHKVKLTRGTKDGTTVGDYNTNGSGYLNTGVSCSSNGYISGMTVKYYGRLPDKLSGSSTTYESDHIYTSTSTGYVCVGGDYDDDNRAGPFCADFTYSAASKIEDISTALSCKPLASIQNS